MTGKTRARLATLTILACGALLGNSPGALGKGKEDSAAASTKAADRSKAGEAKPGKAKASKRPTASTKPAAKDKAPAKNAKATGKDAKPAAGATAKDGKPAKPVVGKPVALARGRVVPLPPARPAGSSKLSPPGPALAAAVPMALSEAAAPEGERTRGVAALSYAPAAALSAGDIDTVKEALALARAGKTSAASERKGQVRDGAAQKLIEWAILRADDSEVGFARYVAFINANPGWPSVGMLRRRAEGQLWHEKRDPGTVFAFFSDRSPASAKGKFAAARALLAEGDRAQAREFVRDAWRNDPLSSDLETQVLESFGELLTRADHKARMDRRLYAQDSEAALRAAKRLGGDEPAIARARIAVNDKEAKGGALLDAVPASARDDVGYTFSRIQWLRRQDRIDEAAKLMLAMPRDPAVIIDTNEWWIERRLIARKLLDAGEARTAYRIARDAARPEKGVYRVEQPFTAGWIALRFLDDPATAMGHFAAIAQGGTRSPLALARAGYWQGRAAEASGRTDEARRHYEVAARYPTAYYGQLARARLGRNDLAVRRPPELNQSQRLSLRQTDTIRALELLYATGNRDLVIPFVADAGERTSDAGLLVMMAEVAARHDDARAMLLIGKSALDHGFSFDHYAFPGIGIPKFASIGPEIDRSLVYSIARQESAFNQRTVSVAKAMGLMQVTPAAGRYIAKKFGVAFHEKKLLTDPVYNTQMGAAEISDLVADYAGNYALAFAAYNAGRGRVRDWIQRYGDPRKGDIDPVDWVERIPFSETRNYVQRVMENMQVYRTRFGRGERLSIEADLRGKAAQEAATE